MKPHVWRTEAARILWPDFPVPITKMMGPRDTLVGQHVQGILPEPLTGIQVALLIGEYIAVHKRTLEVVPVDPDTSADLEGDA